MKIFRKMSISLVAVLALGYSLQSQADFNEKGAPKEVKCTADLLVAKNPIPNDPDINKLLVDHTRVSLGEVNQSCAKYPGDSSGVCIVLMGMEKIRIGYSFNTQNGSLNVDDAATGQSTSNSWTNQYEVTDTGYVTAGAMLRNIHGGLNNNPKAFEIDVFCQATKWQ